ncbi:twin-arginine translocation signal domain-containing protein [Streptomyces sp. NBRC 110611]|uniref:twin-arginine translocation signal domain-containing protein n=1 Tax=Streptomyces sp. NBRC 110611 TaxID=1621259 RepID=UPI0008374BBD|nr:twin-arginine translocation signal domain-containing protein [Streptomyces sp. NBRC 110611]
MGAISRRNLLGMGAGAAAALGIASCSAPGPNGADKVRNSVQARPRLIGDGSTAHYGPQPHQPKTPERLEPGQTPPQFVVFSWDGAGEAGNGLFPRFLKLARDHGAAMTFFLTGLYLLPESQRHRYTPPNNPRGASAIGYLGDDHIRETLTYVRRAWLDGHEVGTHFNGHFCGAARTSVTYWTPGQWRAEIDQAMEFVTQWKTNTGFTDLEPLPFDYRKELVGSRTPCLLGQENLLPTARELGWRYDASSPGGLQMWPRKKLGVWDYPLQQIPFPGHSFEVLSMDYNILANQSKNSTKAPPAHYPGWRRQATDAYISGFRRAYETNRAPFFIGNHFEQWNGGIYMDAVEDALKHIAHERNRDVRLVSFRQLTDWLDAQDPEVLYKLQRIPVGERPGEGWKAYLSAA